MDKNQFAKIPPMGRNSYDYYDTTVTEEQVKANADYMAKNLKPFGWEYIVVDIQWYAHNAGSMRSQFQSIPCDNRHENFFLVLHIYLQYNSRKISRYSSLSQRSSSLRASYNPFPSLSR